jgi:hypothetical protein
MGFVTPLVAVMFATTLAALAPSPAQNAALTALLAKSRAASGAPYRYHIVSRSQETHDGRTFDVTTESEGLKFRAQSCAKTLCTGFYFDGERSYESNFNGTALPIASAVDGLQITLRAIATYAFTDPDFRKNGGTIVERDPILRGGTKYRRISVAPRLGALLDAVVDPATGLVAGVISDERKYAFEFGDQRKVDGKITLPYSISLNGFKFTQYSERSISQAPLEAPAGLTPDLSAGEAKVAMEEREGNAGAPPVVGCTIGGQSAWCMLDTGDSGMSMSLELAEKLGIEPLAGSFDVHGVGQYVTGVVNGPELHVGTATYPAANYVVLHDLSQYGCDIILGADAFAHARITLDYGKKEVRIAPSGPAGSGTPLAFQDFVPVVSVGLDGTDVPLQIDTGDDSAVDLAYDYYEHHQSLFKPSGTTVVNGIGGSSDGVAGTISDVRMAGFDVTHQRIAATKKISFNGHIGSGILDHFVVTIDYSGGTIEFVPRAGDTSVKPAAAALL